MTGTVISRRVVIVTPRFFGYEKAIATEFESQGFEARVVDERPSNNSIVKVIVRLWPALLSWLIRRHFAKIESSLQGQPVDLVLFIKGEVVPLGFIERLRAAYPRAVFAFYAYDAFHNSPRGRALLALMDHAYSFDPVDVERIRGLSYKPLFFTSQFHPLGAGEAKTFDLAFVGTVHSGRHRIVTALFAAGQHNFGFFFSPARWHHALERLLRSDVRSIPRADVSFSKLSHAEVADVFRHARAVIDVQRDGQAGLTMRTFEVLGSGTKLITTNPFIVREPFYDRRWVYLLEGETASWDLASVEHFVHDGVAVPRGLMEPYTLQAWVHGFVGLVGEGSS